jgi:hypothetical protein
VAFVDWTGRGAEGLTYGLTIQWLLGVFVFQPAGRCVVGLAVTTTAGAYGWGAAHGFPDAAATDYQVGSTTIISGCMAGIAGNYWMAPLANFLGIYIDEAYR